MGETTGIAWTDSTINVWHGCTKVSPGCTNCYAEVSTPVRVKRAAGLEVWGPKALRSETKGWERELRRWNREAWHRSSEPGFVHRVFAQSLSDTFEDRRDLDALRATFFAAIERCGSLTFQLLTKRPENIRRMVPPSWLVTGAPPGSSLGWPAHVWIGTTVEDQAHADERIPHLLRVPAAVRFLSVEPMLEAITIPPWAWCQPGGISWVIVGGESGPKARPFDLAWARSIRDQCKAAGVACFVKQLGREPQQDVNSAARFGSICDLRDSHGADPAEWPADLRVQEFPRG